MKITSHASVVAETVQKILDVTITWKIEAAGKIDADIEVTKDDEFPDLPRFGVRMFLDKKLSAVRYFGIHRLLLLQYLHQSFQQLLFSM